MLVEVLLELFLGAVDDILWGAGNELFVCQARLSGRDDFLQFFQFLLEAGFLGIDINRIGEIEVERAQGREHRARQIARLVKEDDFLRADHFVNTFKFVAQLTFKATVIMMQIEDAVSFGLHVILCFQRASLSDKILQVLGFLQRAYVLAVPNFM